MGRFEDMLDNARYLYREEGLAKVFRQAGGHLAGVFRSIKKQDSYDPLNDFVDVLFINGCGYGVPHPIRYRVAHQCEQLGAHGISSKIVDAWNIDIDMVRTARVFVIFRCPYTDKIGEFIERAKALHKKVLFDIDDLVIDRKYTDQIKYLDTLPDLERKGYDEGVDAMQKTMMLCDGVVTTTTALANELRNYKSRVFVNRNVASEEMVYLSERAVYERDTLPRIPEDRVAKSDRKRWYVARERFERREQDDAVSIGYFSGSITHNDDFEMILPVLIEIMEDRSNVMLHVVGELDLPERLAPYRERVVFHPFCPWERLPKLIAQVDINIAPLEDTVFNRAKSENKWLEAALVKVPTVASAVGAFGEQIEDGKTGVLCRTLKDWRSSLLWLIEDRTARCRIGGSAYDECVTNRRTTATGWPFALFLREFETPNIAMVVPSLDISGGNLVTLRHASMLHQSGLDVTVLDGFGEKKWVNANGVTLPVLNRRVLPDEISGCQFAGLFDKAVATFWETQLFVERYRNIGKRYYFVQGYETDFYQSLDVNRLRANATYGDVADFQYLTMSKWCQGWLDSKFSKQARYAPNGIECCAFTPVERDFGGKIRILIEGDCTSDYKNVDESFRIVDRLDSEKFEIWYLSYKGEPKDYYRVDRFFNKVPYEEVAALYRQCHILLKTSIHESFSYPPLEMMATGGFAIVLGNPGNAEYLVDGENCLIFEHGEEDEAACLIERLCEDDALRNRLREGGLRTALSRDWSLIQEDILALYE